MSCQFEGELLLGVPAAGGQCRQLSLTMLKKDEFFHMLPPLLLFCLLLCRALGAPDCSLTLGGVGCNP